MIALTLPAHSLELATSGTASTDWSVSYRDESDTTRTRYASGSGNVTSATTTTIVAAPDASVQRIVEFISVRNRSTTAAQTVTFKRDTGTEYHLAPEMTLQPGEAVQFTPDRGFEVRDSLGRAKITDSATAGTSGYPLTFTKIGITTEAAGVDYTWALNTGMPGAWSPGTEGVNGRVTNGTAADDAGCLPYTNAASGANYLTALTAAASVACTPYLMDVLWVNDALDVTETNEQAIVTPAFPARDNGGAVSGVGVNVGILVTGATGNGGAVTDITLEYTNSGGTAEKTATMASFPASATAGTIVWFQLAAGDVGVKSIDGITIGTTLASGTISLIAARRLAMVPILAVNLAASAPIDSATGVRLYSGSCLLPAATMTTTTATNISGVAQITNR